MRKAFGESKKLPRKFRGLANKHTAKEGMTAGEKVEFLSNKGIKKNGHFRKTISDLCDYCLKFIRINRKALSLRTRGWKFACKICWKNNGFEFGKCKVFCETLPGVHKFRRVYR